MIYLELFLGFLKVGLFSFGGAYGAIPLIREVVLDYGWLDEEMLVYMIAVSESTPGSIMVNLATYAGSERAGIIGAMAATLGVVFPAFAVILLMATILKKAVGNKYMKAVLSGLLPCIIGIILATGMYMIVQNCVKNGETFLPDATSMVLTVLIAAVYFGSVKVLKKRISPITLIGISAALGIIAYA